jgi:hypothetical protein
VIMVVISVFGKEERVGLFVTIHLNNFISMADRKKSSDKNPLLEFIICRKGKLLFGNH